MIVRTTYKIEGIAAKFAIVPLMVMNNCGIPDQHNCLGVPTACDEDE
jgi:hypothetical protein